MNPDQPTTEQPDTLKSFLKEELDDIGTRLGLLKGKIKDEDFKDLEADLNDKNQTLDASQDDDSQLFLLRREIGLLKESVAAMAVKRSWWTKIPAVLWIFIVTLPIVLYLFWLSFVQWRDQSQIYDYPATQTAVAALTTTAPAPSITPTPIPTVTP